MFVSENPTAVLFYLKYDNSRLSCHGYIYLCILAVRLLKIQVVKDTFRIDA